MTYFQDLTPYTYWSDLKQGAIPILNVGWLDKSVPYPIGETSEEFKKRLIEFCFYENVAVLSFGYHECDYCDNPSFGITIQYEGKKVQLGNGEIRVIGNSAIYAAPTLIYHYVVTHAYRPPNEFIEAVLTGPKPGSAEHMALLKDL